MKKHRSLRKMSGKSIQTIDMGYNESPLIMWDVVKEKNRETQKSKSRIIEEHLNDVWMTSKS